MFDQWSYIGYTLLFCLPPLLLLWLRREFISILSENIKVILLSTAVLTVYGSLIWPIALKYGAWAYAGDKFTTLKLFDYVYVDDVVWWIFISLLFTSFMTISAKYEEMGQDLFLREIRGLLQSFKHAFSGLRTITLERNSTIHVAIAVFVLIEAIFFKIPATEWFIVIMLIGLVLALELVNSSIERLSSKVSPETDPEIRLIKDTTAAGVLVASAAALVIGLKIFMFRIITFL